MRIHVVIRLNDQIRTYYGISKNLQYTNAINNNQSQKKKTV